MAEDTISDGIPKENFQANHHIIGAAVYRYGNNVVVEIEGSYWLYENINSTKDQQGELSERADRPVLWSSN